MSPPSSPEGLGTAFAESLPFGLDDFQVRALEAVGEDRSVLVAAPTGSGKTVVAEFACWRALQRGAKCFYTTPLKALSNQKFGDLVARHGAGRVGLLTGDNSINGEAPIVVMTTEVLRNMIYERSRTLDGLRWVVLDEVHYLQDPYRGAVWEEVLIHLAPEVRAVCLSATVSNWREFGDWLDAVRGPVTVVVENTRPVELRNLVMVGHQLYSLFADEAGGAVHPELDRVWTRGTAAAARYGYRAPGKPQRPPNRSFTPTRVEVTEILERENMLPAIQFIFSRLGCDKAVEACLFADVRLTDGDEAQRIAEFADMRAGMLDHEDLRALRYGTFLEGLRRGVAAHHAGMLPIFKETVEELFALGLLKLVFATETLSLGINMPARTVVIERLTKFTGERHELLTPTDYTQLTGRAGRRGIDEIGYAVTLFNPFVPVAKLAQLASARSFELTSSFRPSYNMAVNLIRNYSFEEAEHVLNSSFAQFSVGRDVVKWEQRLAEKEREAARLRDLAACEHGDVVEYARLRNSAGEALGTQRGSEEVRRAFAKLAPGDVVYGDGIGRALVLEQPRKASGADPRITVLTADRKLRRVTPRDFRSAPEPVARVTLRGQSWRSPKVRRNLAREVDRLDVRRPAGAPSRERAGELVRAVESHPAHECPDIERHLEVARELVKLERAISSLRRRIRRERGTVARTFEKVVAVMRGLHYVEDWTLTPKGELLTRIYNESDLLIVECLSRGWLGGLDPQELASLVSVFVYESRGREDPESAPTPHLGRFVRRILNLHKQLSDAEAREGVELLKEPDAGFMAQAFEWAGGATLEDVLESRETTAGDFVRNAKQVIDLLEQLRKVVHDEERDTVSEAIGSMRRGVVAYSSVV